MIITGVLIPLITYLDGQRSMYLSFIDLFEKKRKRGKQCESRIIYSLIYIRKFFTMWVYKIFLYYQNHQGYNLRILEPKSMNQ